MRKESLNSFTDSSESSITSGMRPSVSTGVSGTDFSGRTYSTESKYDTHLTTGELYTGSSHISSSASESGGRIIIIPDKIREYGGSAFVCRRSKGFYIP